jgi:aminopeptidase N
MLQEIQRTGDIFFPSRWAYFLLCGHHSKAARNEVDRFINDNPDYPQLLKNKILQAAYSPG